MKREDLEKQGLSKEQIDAVLDMHHKEIDPVNRKLEETESDLNAANEKVKTTEEALKAFDGVDPAALNQKIADLQKDLQTKDAEYQAQIADRDFQDMLKESIAAAKGKIPKAIMALMDIDALKESKNQKTDIEEALKALAEAEESKMLFGETEAEEVGKGDPIGVITKLGSSGDAWEAQMMAAAKTSVLDGAPELAKEGANANELIIPKIEMDGLADYDRSSGYKAGDVTFSNETVKCNFDRGRMFTVDNVDNMDTAGVSFSRLGSEFIRTKVTPELDAFRMATYAGVEGADITAATYATGEEVLKAISAKYDAMTDAEVPEEDRHLFITPALLGMVRDLDTTKSKEVLAGFASIQKMPQSRFYSAITQSDNGYAKAEGGHNMNFMIVHKPAVIQFAKHVKPKVVDPDTNQDADAWKYGYRNVSIADADAYENKAAGNVGTATVNDGTPVFEPEE